MIRSSLTIALGLGLLMPAVAAHATDTSATVTNGEFQVAQTAGSNNRTKDTKGNKVDPTKQEGKSHAEGAVWDETRWRIEETGEPTYRISEDGTTDWATYEGFKRYHSECHVCHGPSGMGSTFAPALAESLKTMSYADFQQIIASGREGQGRYMPAFATNPNVMCFVDDLWTYLKGRADGVIGRGRTPVKKHVRKMDSTREFENECLGL